MVALAILANCAFSQTKSKPKDSTKNAPSGAPYRVKYDQVFTRNSDGSYSPIKTVQINGEIMGSDVPFKAGTSFGGVDVAAMAGHDLLIDTVKNIVIIRSIFKQ